MNSKKLNKQVDLTNYWDAQLLDFEIKYLGDEASLYIERYDEPYSDYLCWEIRFLRCAKVTYETEAGWVMDNQKLWREEDVKDLRDGALLGYACQDIKITEQDEWFYNCNIVIANMDINITCQDIEVLEVTKKDKNFLWYK